MGKLISPYQNAFVPKRQISDNIALAHELLRTMKSKKAKSYFMAIKIDLEKAYDKLEWNFIKHVLVSSEFPPKVVNWIMTCIETVQFEVTINGSISEKMEA